MFVVFIFFYFLLLFTLSISLSCSHSSETVLNIYHWFWPAFGISSPLVFLVEIRLLFLYKEENVGPIIS